MEEKKSNVQLFPAKVRVVPNCKLAKVTANLAEQSYSKLISGKNAEIVEKRVTKKRAEVVSTFTVSNAEGYDNSDPLTFFDYCVLSVCISEQLAGNNYTTLAIILRGLTGKTRKNANGTSVNNGIVNPDQRNAIMHSIEKMMSTIIKVDNSVVNKELGYEGEKIKKSAILPAFFETHIINGQIVEDTIYFDRLSPIFEVANQRNQIIRYDSSLLDVSNQNNTPLVISIKNYVMLRVMEIINHKMTPTITLADIFKKCRIDGTGKKYNMTREVKNVIDKFLEHLQSKGVIKSFNWKKQGTKIHGVEFTF